MYSFKKTKMSLYGSLIKQEADYTTAVDEKLPECEKLVQVKKLFSFLKNYKIDFYFNNSKENCKMLLKSCFNLKNKLEQ